MAECVINTERRCPFGYITGKICSACKTPDLTTPIKLKFQGVTLTVVQLFGNDRITDRALYRIADDVTGTWHRSEASGDLVRDHPTRQYVHVLSPWWK